MTLSLSLGLVGLTLLVSGALLLPLRPSRPSAVLLGLAGVALLTGAVLMVAGGPAAADLGPAAERLGLLLLLPLGLATYPRPGRHGVDVAALVLVTGAGLTAIAWNDTAVADLAGVGVTVVLVAHTWWRLERSVGPERRALTWMVVAVGFSAVVIFVASFGFAEDAGVAVGVSALALIGPACAIGVRVPDLVDVRGVVVTLVVGVVAASVYVATWVLLVALLAALGLRDPSLGTLGLLGALAALGVHPVQRVLRSSVDQVLFGIRPDPLGAASQVVRSMGEDPQQALNGIREVLVLPHVALRRPDGRTLVSGAPVPHVRTVPLGKGAGELIVGLRAGDLRLSAEDQRVLGIAAPLLAQLLRATDLTDDVARSRAVTVTALEEERRRLRRDLHDGLGPRLTGIAFSADAARNLLRTDPAAADVLLATLRAETATAISEIRELVYGMRPPALDELGLVPALRQHAASVRDRDGRPVEVTVAAEPLPDGLPAAVEVAVYRIVTEALTNVARHSGGRRAEVELGHEGDAIRLRVSDDGGLGRSPTDATTEAAGPDWRRGVGISSMAERAAEVGGRLSAGPTARGGEVVARLPTGVGDAGRSRRPPA